MLRWLFQWINMLIGSISLTCGLPKERSPKTGFSVVTTFIWLNREVELVSEWTYLSGDEVWSALSGPTDWRLRYIKTYVYFTGPWRCWTCYSRSSSTRDWRVLSPSLRRPRQRDRRSLSNSRTHWWRSWRTTSVPSIIPSTSCVAWYQYIAQFVVVVLRRQNVTQT